METYEELKAMCEDLYLEHGDILQCTSIATEEEIREVSGIPYSDDWLAHYGTPRHSGRYPWGSGENPYQRLKSFQGHVYELRKQGVKDTDIAKGMDMNTSQLRARMSIARDELWKHDMAEAVRLHDKGLSNVAIAKRMGINESSVRNLLKQKLQDNRMITEKTVELLKRRVAEDGLIDVGEGSEPAGMSRDKFKVALEAMRAEGYVTIPVQVEQAGTGQMTTILTLAPEGTTYKDIKGDRKYSIKPVEAYTENQGRSFLNVEPVESVSSKRVQVKYAEDGGTERDGLIELRRGVPDLDLGQAHYAQVRIGVDGTHYLKGMAVYADDLPDGVDIRFNTNKSKGTPMIGPKDNSVLKPMKTKEDGSIDMDNPFGATIRQKDDLIKVQKHYIDKDGKEKVSALNVVEEEGNWSNWSKSLASQLLSKQPLSLAKKQLAIDFDMRKEEFDELDSLTNPTIKRHLMMSFADECDAAASTLHAAAIPRQASHVILPFSEVKPTEVYAPGYRDGEKVVLVRYPHGGRFEMPELTVNNKITACIKTLGKGALDAIGINHKTAQQLSGADFDGDTVLVIPNNNGAFKTAQPLKGLKDFDPNVYHNPDLPKMKDRTKQMQMGIVSNLITDMTLHGATPDELTRAVRHSMVVIDAQKHQLDYKKSAIDNGIAELKEKYQGGKNKGASTLISLAGRETEIPERRLIGVDKATGEKIYRETGKTKGVYDKETNTWANKLRMEKTTEMQKHKDAFELSSGTPMEAVYASHANKLKALANKARKIAVSQKPIEYSPSAAKLFAPEIAYLKDALLKARRNAPKERQAQLIAEQTWKAKKKADPGMEYDKLQRIKGQAIQAARFRVGAKKPLIDITDNAWKAIQSGAIHTNMLLDIMQNTSDDSLKARAMPRASKGMSSAKLARAKSMISNGCSLADVADALGVSASVLRYNLNQ